MKTGLWLHASFLCIVTALYDQSVLAQDNAAPAVEPKYYPPPQRLLRGQALREITRLNPNLGEYTRFYTSWQDPANRILNPGTGYDGVCEVRVTRTDGTMYGTGHLLPTGRHIVTAAHLLYNGSDVYVATGAGQVRFDMATGDQFVNFATSNPFHVHPDFDGHEAQTPDLLIISLAAQAPAASERREIYRGGSIVGQQLWVAGYGLSGYGTTGGVTDDSERRGGENIFDADASALNGKVYPANTFVANNMVLSDFDNYTKTNDALGHFGIASQLGVAGFREVSPALGDSGGPLLINNQIAAVVQGGLGFVGAPDYSSGTNSSFGEIAFYTLLSPRQAWHDQIVPPVVNKVSVVKQVPTWAEYVVPTGSGEQLRTVPIGHPKGFSCISAKP